MIIMIAKWLKSTTSMFLYFKEDEIFNFDDQILNKNCIMYCYYFFVLESGNTQLDSLSLHIKNQQNVFSDL